MYFLPRKLSKCLLFLSVFMHVYVFMHVIRITKKKNAQWAGAESLELKGFNGNDVQGGGGDAQGGLHRSPDWLAQSLSYYSCMHGYFFLLEIKMEEIILLNYVRRMHSVCMCGCVGVCGCVCVCVCVHLCVYIYIICICMYACMYVCIVCMHACIRR
jgi:hypothetical protein